jgi:hypothetical protein
MVPLLIDYGYSSAALGEFLPVQLRDGSKINAEIVGR